MNKRKVSNILSIILVLSIIVLFIYIYAIPWFKGTFKESDDPNCAATDPPQNCKNGSYCCQDPRVGGSYCMSKKCSDIRLEHPTDNQVNFFNIYLICVSLIIVLLFTQ